MEPKYQCKNIVASGHTTVNLSRLRLLRWINELLGVKLQKVEALCTGAIYCQIMDMLFPGCISLKKVKFEANQATEYWNNFKQLQIAFRAVGCEKNVPIDLLIKGRFQENFEFLQWFKRFYDVNSDESLCNPVTVTPILTNVQQSTSRVHTRPIGMSSRSYDVIPDEPLGDPVTVTPIVPKAHSTSRRPVATINPVSKQTQVEREMKSQMLEYQDKAEKIMQEKDFYFNKLRNIEILCTSEDALNTNKETLVNKILAELYATEEGFDAPEEDDD